jgi:hypothetical protein
VAEGIPWAEPRWITYNYKHRVTQAAPWKKVVPQTAQRGNPAKYCLDITDADQEEIELRCLREGTLIAEEGSLRMYYMNAGRIIGASAGGETEFVYVEYNRLGDVHGRPITRQDLQRLGVQL